MGPALKRFSGRQACPGLSVACPKPASSLHPRAPPANAARQPAGLPRPLCGLSEACLFSSPTGPRPQTFLQAAAWPTKLFLWASEGNVRHPRAPPSKASRQPAGLPRPLCGLSEACLFSSPTGPRPQTFLQAAAWPTKLFLWASEGNVRHPRAPPSKASRQPAGLPRPLCGLSEACLFSSPTGPARKRFCRPQLGPQSFFYGLPKATLDTHGPRPQTLLGSRQACPGLSVACPKPASSLHPRAPPANVSAGCSLAHKASSMGFRRQRRGLSVA